MKEVGVPQISAREISAREISVPEISAREISAREIRVPEISVPEIDAPQVSVSQIGAPEGGALKISILKIGIPQVGVHEGGFFSDCLHHGITNRRFLRFVNNLFTIVPRHNFHNSYLLLLLRLRVPASRHGRTLPYRRTENN